MITHTVNIVGGDVAAFAKHKGKLASDFAGVTASAVYIDATDTMVFVSGQNALTSNFNCPIRGTTFISMADYRKLFPESFTVDFVLKPSKESPVKRKTKTQIARFVASQFVAHPAEPAKTYPLTLMQCAKHTVCTATAVGTGTNGDGGDWTDPGLAEVWSNGCRVPYM